MRKTAVVILVLLPCLSIGSLMSGPKKPRDLRVIKAGMATLLIPKYLPREVIDGTERRGSVIIGEMDERCICYEQFLAVYWSDRAIPNAALLPAPAYVKVSEFSGSLSKIAGVAGDARIVTLQLTARKPCGKTVKADLKIIKIYCEKTKTYFAIAGLTDPLLTEGKLAEIAESLDCH